MRLPTTIKAVPQLRWVCQVEWPSDKGDRIIRTVLPEHFEIIGAGGINSGRAMLDYLKAALPNDLRPTSDRFERLA